MVSLESFFGSKQNVFCLKTKTSGAAHPTSQPKQNLKLSNTGYVCILAMDAGERSVELGVLLFLGDSLLSVYSRQIVTKTQAK